jgi:ankyrin repeat protein
VSGRGSEKIIRFLVEQGASLEARDKRDRTPLDLAVTSRRTNAEALAELLKELAN